MAFADPQSVTVNSVAQSMPRIETQARRSVYRKADGTFQLTISHSTPNGRLRSMARIDQFAIVTDPVSSLNDSENLGAYLIIDRPTFGFTQTQVEQLVAGLTAYLTTTNVGKLFAQES